MAFKQPKVPEYRGTEKMEAYIRKLTLFLRDFCQEAWNASRLTGAEIGKVRGDIPTVEYPVTSVNQRRGDVVLGAHDVGALAAGDTAENAKNAANATNAAKLEGRTWAQMLSTLYPVGSVYMSMSSTSPASLFGGTWEQIKDRFLLAAGGSYGAGSAGGEAMHTLSYAEMPSHTHAYYFDMNSGIDWRIGLSDGNAEADRSAIASGPRGRGYTLNIRAAGGSQAHNNMPPYLAVYMWRRVS